MGNSEQALWTKGRSSPVTEYQSEKRKWYNQPSLCRCVECLVASHMRQLNMVSVLLRRPSTTFSGKLEVLYLEAPCKLSFEHWCWTKCNRRTQNSLRQRLMTLSVWCSKWQRQSRLQRMFLAWSGGHLDPAPSFFYSLSLGYPNFEVLETSTS